MNIIEKVHRAIFEGTVATVPVTPNVWRRDLPVNLIVMSRDSAREIRRAQGYITIKQGADKTQPDRLYGVRIAYDDSLGLGEFIAAYYAGEDK